MMKKVSGTNAFWPLAAIAAPIVIGALVFNIFHYSSAFGIIEINSINAILFAPFLALVFGLGMLLRQVKDDEDFETTFTNGISAREKEVIDLILLGKKNREIAAALFIDISTVKTHINNIYRKTDVKNRKELQATVKNRSIQEIL